MFSYRIWVNTLPECGSGPVPSGVGERIYKIPIIAIGVGRKS